MAMFKNYLNSIQNAFNELLVSDSPRKYVTIFIGGIVIGAAYARFKKYRQKDGEELPRRLILSGIGKKASKHAKVAQANQYPHCIKTESLGENVVKQGFLLLKKGAHSLFIQREKETLKFAVLTNDGYLCLYSDFQHYLTQTDAERVNLLLTTVRVPGRIARGVQLINPPNRPQDKDSGDADCGFTLVSVDGHVWRLWAETVRQRQDWVRLIETQIEKCLEVSDLSRIEYEETPDVSLRATDIKLILRAVEGNAHCAECGEEEPTWASVNLGIVICIECAGIHRSLGSDRSRIWSLELDEWRLEHIAIMTAAGNSFSNALWEGKMGDASKPKPSSSRDEKTRWIISKYVDRCYVTPDTSTESNTQRLVGAIKRNDIQEVMRELVYSTEDDINSSWNGSRPLNQAAAMGCLSILQLLLWRNAQMMPDDDRRTPVQYASLHGNHKCMQLLEQHTHKEKVPSTRIRRRTSSRRNINAGASSV